MSDLSRIILQVAHSYSDAELATLSEHDSRLFINITFNFGLASPVVAEGPSFWSSATTLTYDSVTPLWYSHLQSGVNRIELNPIGLWSAGYAPANVMVAVSMYPLETVGHLTGLTTTVQDLHNATVGSLYDASLSTLVALDWAAVTPWWKDRIGCTES